MEPNYWREGNLCNVCNLLLTQITHWLRNSADRPREEKVPHHGKPDLLLAHAKNGCHLCSIMFGTMFLTDGTTPRQAEQWLRSEAAVKVYKPFVKISAAWSSNAGFSTLGGPPEAAIELELGVPSVNMTYVMPRNNRSESRPAMHGREASKSRRSPGSLSCNFTGDAEAFRLISWWLQICREEHPECQNSQSLSPPQRPARLIDVSGPPNGVKVVEFHENDIQPDYLALSYVWGEQKSKCLINQDLEAMQANVDLHELPRTIRHAVNVTRKLGYQFLWVDSLCIIQDSQEDWTTEAAKMGSIYQHAILTLAALHASGNHEGLFTTRNPLCTRSLLIPGTEYEISNSANYSTWEYDGRNAPLQSRAWVVQERMSARRTVFFGATGVYWECRRCQASESNIDGILNSMSVNYKKKLRDIMNIPSSGRTAELLSYMRKFVDIWQAVRGLYTSAHLTHETDRPVAISGLMNNLASISGFACAHGIWLDLAAHDLLWKPVRPRERTVIFPTWSWLSVRQPVESLLKSHKYWVVWAGSVRLLDEMLSDDTASLRPLRIDANWPPSGGLHPRSTHSLTLYTDVRQVCLLSESILLLKPRPEHVRSDSMFEYQRPKQPQYHWDCDSPPLNYQLASPLKYQSSFFIHIAHFESFDDKRIGAAGIIATMNDNGDFERLGVLKHWVKKDTNAFNDLPPTQFESIEREYGLAYAAKNPFAQRKQMLQVVRLV